MERMINLEEKQELYDHGMTQNVIRLIRYESKQFNDTNYTPEIVEIALEEAA